MRATRLGRARRVGEEAVSEVLGYVLMLFLSSAVLMMALQAFLLSRDVTTSLQEGTELRLVGERVASAVAEAGYVASQLPNATYQERVALPDLGGQAYRVNASQGQVWVNTTDGAVSANATAFDVETFPNIVFQGTVYSAQGALRVTYENTPNNRWINLTL